MRYELISESEYADLPEDSEQCFVQFEAICRRNMMRIIDASKSDYTGPEIRAQYMASVAAVAQECGITSVNVPSYDEEHAYEAFRSFYDFVQGEIARIRIRSRGTRHTWSVQLTPTTKTKIEHYIGRLRALVDSSDLSDEKKDALHARLSEFLAELTNHRFRFSMAMALLSQILVGVAAATTTAAEGPTAVTNIMKLIAHDKDSEDAARLRLAPPQKALPSPVTEVSTGSSTPTWDMPRGDLDDEIPF